VGNIGKSHFDLATTEPKAEPIQPGNQPAKIPRPNGPQSENGGGEKFQTEGNRSTRYKPTRQTQQESQNPNPDSGGKTFLDSFFGCSPHKSNIAQTTKTHNRNYFLFAIRGFKNIRRLLVWGGL
jgi:hypothetical protein